MLINQVVYQGEHLWVGNIGHALIILGFVSALLSAFAYFYAVRERNHDRTVWSGIADKSFILHGISIIGLIGLIFYAMYQQMYEYMYVFDHVSPDLPMKYILSAFWEGQEGSFLLWMFWHIMLGWILIKKAGKWKAPVMFSLAAVEAILVTMILGIHIPWGEEFVKIGSNPTVLLRHMNDAPIFANADYLTLIKGRGLNPLLQNYWMTIHPPTLFLGFASTIVPFAYAFAGLWLNEHKDWLRPAMAWSLFSAGILGLGILMGSFWAYEALSFGGYWAWDPVENASLVPWITLVAGIHTHLIASNTGHAKKSLYFFYLISFILILYSTFLTRSGVLGDTSAHAFTEMGLEWQLILLMAFFIFSGFGLWIYRWKGIDTPSQEESIFSKEFWLFIGALVLMFSAVLITASTSLPVFNKLMTWYNPGYVGKVIQDPIPHYNKYQMWIAVFVAVLSSKTIFLRYRTGDAKSIKERLLFKFILYTALSAVLTFAFSTWLQLYSWQYVVLCFAGFFAVTANAGYLISVLKANIKLGASAVAHFGFGLMIAGILASGLNKTNISSNPFVFAGIFTKEDLARYVQLIKGKPLYSKGYFITYEQDTLIDRTRSYTIRFEKLDEQMNVLNEVKLYPNAVYSNDFTKVAAFNPDTKHYLHKDIFTCVVGLPPALQNVEEAKSIEDSLKFINYPVQPGDTIMLNNAAMVLNKIHFKPTHEEYLKHTHDTGIAADLSVFPLNSDTVYQIQTALGIDGALMYKYPESVEDLGLRIQLDETLIRSLFTSEENLRYEDVTIKNFGSIEWKGYTIKLSGFDKNPEHKNYTKEDGDLSIGAILTVQNREGEQYEVKPIYIIRDNIPMSIKEHVADEGLHIRFSNIDPAKEEFTFKLAKDNRPEKAINISIAQDVPRTDYIILEATIFPGINLFWGGTLLMTFGLFLGMINRLMSRNRTT